MLKFIDRAEELNFLEQRYKGKDFEFFVIYGRRRIGKTELIKAFLSDKPHIYLLCDKSGIDNNIDRFKKKIAEYLGEPVIATNNIEEFFSYLKEKVNNRRFVIVFDEFSYLVEKNASVPSLFQVVVDEILKNTDIFLILCGSSISMMERGVLSHKSPLYGRKTAHMRIFPITFNYFHDFFPLNNMEKNIEFYSILGGVPFYLEKFSGDKKTFENAKEQILDKNGKLYEEIDFLLKEELREPDVYKTILNAIASGKTKVVEIANTSKIKTHDIDKYLKVLMRLGILKKEIPVTETKSKKSIYYIDDNFFDFYFSFYEPYKSDLGLGEFNNAMAKLKEGFSSYVGKKFEKFIQEEILRKLDIMEIQRAGRWWGHYRDSENKRNEVEIDIVALNEKNSEILFAECKWQENVDAEEIYNGLLGKKDFVEWHNRKRKERFAVFAKSFKKKIRQENLMLFDLNDMKRIFRAG